MPPRAAPPPQLGPPPQAPVINDSYDVVAALEIQDTLDSMPVELTKSFADLRELDAVLNATIAHITGRLARLAEAMRDPRLAPHERFKLLVEIGDECSRFKLGGEDKIRVAGNACEFMIHHQVHVNDLLGASSLLAPDPLYHPPPQLAAPHLTARRPRGSPMPARAVAGGSGAGAGVNSAAGGAGAGAGGAAGGETTPSKKRRIGVVGAGLGVGAGAGGSGPGATGSREDDRDETFTLGKKPAGGAKDKKIGAIKRKTTTARASPTPSLAQSLPFAPPQPTTSASGRAQRPNAGRNRQYDDEAPAHALLPGGAGAAHLEDDEAGSYGSPARSSGVEAGAGAAVGGAGGAGGPAARKGRQSSARKGAQEGVPASAPGARGKGPLGASSAQPAAAAALAHAADEMDVDDPGPGAEGEDGAEAGEDQKTYCYCHGLSAGEMIGCDAEDCPIEWFHLVCLDLSEPPAGDWLCPECTTRLEPKGGKAKGARGGAAGKAAKGKVKR